MTSKRFRYLITIAFAAGALASGPALAQSTPGYGQPPAASPQSPSEQFSNEQVAAFAEANGKISEIMQEWQPKLNDAKSAAQAAEIQREAQQKMVEVVQDSGMSVDQFNALATAAQQDPQLQQRIMEHMD